MRVEYMPTAAKYLLGLDKKEAHRIVRKVELYARAENPLHFAQKLSDYQAYKFRVGMFRVVFDYEGDTISVLVIDKRKDVYRNL